MKSGQGSNTLGLDAHHAATLDLPSRLLPTTQSPTSPSRGNRLHTALQMWLQLSLHHVVTHITSTASLSPLLNPSSFPTYFSFETQRKSSTLHGLFPDAPDFRKSCKLGDTAQPERPALVMALRANTEDTGLPLVESEICLGKAWKVLRSYRNHLLNIFICF